MHFSANARSWDRMSSVCPSETLVDCDHIGWKSWKLIARAVSPTPSLFAAKRRSTYTPRGTWGNFGQTRGGVGENGVLEKKSGNTVSLKHVKMEEKLLWRAYRNSPMLFRTVPSRPPMAPFLEIGSFQLSYPLLSQERVKLRASNFVGTFIGSIGTKAHEKCWEYRIVAVGVVRESRKYLGHPSIGRIARSSLR